MKSQFDLARAHPEIGIAQLVTLNDYQEGSALEPGIDTGLTNMHMRFLLDGLGVNFYFGGTSLLIVVGVAMDTVNQIEAQLIMRHYEGFTPRSGRIRGRRSSF